MTVDTKTPTPRQTEVPTLPLEATVRNISKILRGKEDVVRLALVGFLARGHLLLEDVPGVGKTTLARALARSVGGTFKRIQLTSDLLPADLLGGQVLNRKTQELEFKQGPVFANVVLADELNRATPRTQSGLLEAMSERSVSIDGVTHRVPDPFMVIATQNPVEHHGVYPLPESQLDRFLIRMRLGYPDEETERRLLVGDVAPEKELSLSSIEPTLKPEMVKDLTEMVDRVTISEDVAGYLQDIVRRTRETRELETGVSTRGVILYARAVRAHALLYGRSYATPDDVRTLAVPVCAHRVTMRGARRLGRAEAEAVLEAILSETPVPV